MTVAPALILFDWALVCLYVLGIQVFQMLKRINIRNQREAVGCLIINGT